MPFLSFLREHGIHRFWELVAIAGVSALLNAGLLAIINASYSADSGARDRYTLLWALGVLGYAMSQYYLMTQAAKAVEAAIDNARVHLVQQLLKADLLGIERLGRSAVYTSFARDLQTLSQTAFFIVGAAQGGLIVTFSLIYLLILSPIAFAVTVCLVGTGAFIYTRLISRFWSKFTIANERQAEMLNLVGQTLDGFKEAKLHAGRAEAIELSLRNSSKALASLRNTGEERFAQSWVFSQAFFFVLMGVLVFVLPKFAADYGAVSQKVTSVILFIVAPIAVFGGVMRPISEANAAVESLRRLGGALDRESEGRLTGGSVPPDFKSLRLDAVEFAYTEINESSFRVGPINVEIPAGQIVFLTGSNGSGKSTLLKIVAGLYEASSGRLLMDESEITQDRLASYRSLFSAVFSDHFVYDELYGLPHFDQRLVEELLRRFEIFHNTSLSGKKWVTRDLSAAQSKRLALIVAQLEERPVWILDEWAADQDPVYREMFYRELLPQLKRIGKTIIAVTQDERYFDAADRVYNMDMGQLQPHERGSS